MITQPIADERLQALTEAAANPEWVADDARLRALCEHWRTLSRVALDTEFQRVDTFYPIPGLIQVAAEGRCYLIDPLAINDFAPFSDLLRDTSVLKLLHACSEDLELFAHSYGATPTPLFDTQVACAFLDLGLSIGYQRLLDTLFSLPVDKQETRSDWLQRPLTEAQKHYAAVDVVYLEAIYQRLAPRLEEQGKWEWVMDECAQMAQAQADDRIDPDYYLKFKQAWKLRPEQLAVLKALCQWREEQARERDMPRNFLIKNNTLWSLAVRMPQTMRELSQAEQIRGRTLSQDGKTLLGLICSARDAAGDNAPEAPPRPLAASSGRQLKVLKSAVQDVAAQRGLAPELLARRRDLEDLLRIGSDDARFELPRGLRGWRESLVKEPLLKVLAEND
ncbi:ribonuclease D [Motiliproteus sp. SC1-56]|uniref:ribonuclease D n=1 Tax=Motiliproteus sp. SC1-56 TaxID=2799565 RepID=UPI001A8F3C35|nr:ribonuclease D [Motiliproteus sp. SC1-56]